MGKRLRHVVGQVSELRFTIKVKGYDGVISIVDLANYEVWLEVEKDGVNLLEKSTEVPPDGMVKVIPTTSGQVDARIEWADLAGEPTQEADYAVLIRDPSAGDLERREVIRGKIDIVAQIVDDPP